MPARPWLWTIGIENLGQELEALAQDGVSAAKRHSQRDALEREALKLRDEIADLQEALGGAGAKVSVQ